MSVVTRETKKDSYKKIEFNNRYGQILKKLIVPKTARELAMELYKEGEIPAPERNYTASRLSELEDMGLVKSFKKKKCQFTGKEVAVYERVDFIVGDNKRCQ